MVTPAEVADAIENLDVDLVWDRLNAECSPVEARHIWMAGCDEFDRRHDPDFHEPDEEES